MAGGPNIYEQLNEARKEVRDLRAEVERLEKENFNLLGRIDSGGRRMELLQSEVDELQAQLSEVQADYEQLNNRYYEVTQKYEAQLSRYQSGVEVETVVLYDDWNSGILELALGDLLTKEWIGKRVRVLVLPAEVDLAVAKVLKEVE